MMFKELENGFIKLQFTGKSRVRIYRKLVRFLRNGMALPTALQTMWKFASYDGKRNKDTKAYVLNMWLQSVRNGSKFSAAVGPWVPEMERVAIEAGEKAGRIDVALENVISLQEARTKMISTLVKGLFKPFLIFMAVFVYLYVFGVEVMPQFEDLLPREKWTGIAGQMAMLSDFTRDYFIWTMIGIVLTCVLINWSMSRWTGKLRTYFDYIPPWSVYRVFMGNGFLMSISALARAGSSDPENLKILSRHAGPWYRERLQRTLHWVANGRTLGTALAMTGFWFPDRETVIDLQSYSTMGDVDEALEKIAKESLEESVAKLDFQTGLLAQLSYVVFGCVFAWLIRGLFALEQLVSSQTQF